MPSHSLQLATDTWLPFRAKALGLKVTNPAARLRSEE